MSCASCSPSRRTTPKLPARFLARKPEGSGVLRCAPGAFLSGANLEWAGLASTNLEGADLSDTRLKETLLTGASLEKARLDKAHLKGAWANETTRRPAGFDWRRAGVRQVR